MAFVTPAMLPPAPRRPGMTLKRDSSHLDDDLSSSQAKKRNVAFDEKVDVRTIQDWTEKSQELIKEEVRHTIERHLAGDDTGYEQLRRLFTTAPFEEDAPSTKLLKRYVVALTSHVRLLGGCQALVHSVCECSWLGREESFISLFIRFLDTLISRHGGFLSGVLEELVRKFAGLKSSLGRLPNQLVVSLAQLRQRVHLVLKHILVQIPRASSALPPILEKNFPFQHDSKRTHVEYVKNLLKLADRAPELKTQILALITERLVKIDVKIQVDMEDLQEDIEDKLVQTRRLGDGEEDDNDSGDESDEESVSSSELTQTPEEENIRELKEAVAKMDAIMDILFAYYTPIFTSGNAIEIGETHDTLLSHFVNIVLPSYRSRHTQFLAFHFSQMSPYLIERFAGECAVLTTDTSNTQPAIIRLSAAAYLASFVARGAHIEASMVRSILVLLARHLDWLCTVYSPSCRGPDPRRYSLYYGIAQAMLYIFCFRWRDLVLGNDDDDDDAGADQGFDDDAFSDGEDLIWVPGIKECLTRNIYSPLNPLKICSPAIVHQFAAIANHLRFLYVYPLLESNKRVRLSAYSGASSGSSGASFAALRRETALTGRVGERDLQLDAYFPFDPYHLPVSKRWLEGDYNEWKGVPGMKDEDEEEDEDDESGSGSESEELDSDGLEDVEEAEVGSDSS
ncbi:DNA independent RNA polymerase I transcription factor [Elasticomyces elasticus]|nr:DNA independent RNA polymerase I transcription factor [Elasticomyces elasticus]KAK4993335.1 DNA independent RNA polymerase I transcription factor [Elasticomyces elasticus]